MKEDSIYLNINGKKILIAREEKQYNPFFMRLKSLNGDILKESDKRFNSLGFLESSVRIEW